MDTFSIVIIGIYTVIYLIVFLIQNSQIKQTKEINNSMKSFMDIFKIDEVKKYVELKHESVMMQVDNLLANNSKIKDIATDVVKDKADILKDIYIKQMGDDHMELVKFVIMSLKTFPQNERAGVIESHLPKTKRYFMKMLDDIENNEI